MVPIGNHRVSVLAYGGMLVNTRNNPSFVGEHMLRLAVIESSTLAQQTIDFRLTILPCQNVPNAFTPLIDNGVFSYELGAPRLYLTKVKTRISTCPNSYFTVLPDEADLPSAIQVEHK